MTIGSNTEPSYATQLDIERPRTEFHQAINQQTWRIIGFVTAVVLVGIGAATTIILQAL